MEGTSDSPPARVSSATDPFSEQRLEVEGFTGTTSPPPPGNGVRLERPPPVQSNGMGAEQAVVTPYGWERGELFEGSKRRG
jgi:hypothetical protein